MAAGEGKGFSPLEVIRGSLSSLPKILLNTHTPRFRREIFNSWRFFSEGNMKLVTERVCVRAL